MVAFLATVALAAWAPGTASADVRECGEPRGVKNLTADGLSCEDAKTVAKTWKRLCGAESRCALDVASLGEQYVCKGRRVGGNNARITCTGQDSGAKARFTAAV